MAGGLTDTTSTAGRRARPAPRTAATALWLVAAVLAASVVSSGAALAAKDPAPPPPAPSARADAAMATFGDSTAVLFGGDGPNGVLGDTWSWNGAGWTALAPQSSPTPRAGAAMAYDATRGTAILFGGRTGSSTAAEFLGDTWSWDGSTWTAHPVPVGGPPARSDAALAAGPDGTLVLFGGAGPDGVLGDTWTWNGVAWLPHVQTTDTPPPTARRGAAMARAGNHTVLFGGDDGTQLFGDTWLWSGSGWRQALGSAPRDNTTEHSMSTDLTPGRAVMFGGLTFVNETWIWEGLRWGPSAVVVKPPTRKSAAMTLVPDAGHVVLFGGHDGTNFLGDTWAWSGAAWQAMGPSGGKEKKTR